MPLKTQACLEALTTFAEMEVFESYTMTLKILEATVKHFAMGTFELRGENRGSRLENVLILIHGVVGQGLELTRQFAAGRCGLAKLS